MANSSFWISLLFFLVTYPSDFFLEKKKAT